MGVVKKILRFLSQNWLKILIGLFVFTIVISIIARVFLPEKVEVKAPQISVTENLAGKVEVEFTGERNLPASLSIYRGGNFLNPNGLAEFFATKLNLPENPEVPDLYTNDDTSVSLSQVGGTGLAEYSNTNSLSQEKITLTEAEELARTFLSQLGYPVGQMQVQEDGVQYLLIEGNEGFEETQPENAVAITLPFVREIEDYPVAFDSTLVNYTSVRVMKNGVQSATLTSLFFDFERAQTTTLLTIDQVLDQVRKGNFVILGTINVVDPSRSENAIRRLHLDKRQVEYRFDITQELFIPFVQFSGTATLENRRVVEITLTTPAIETAPAIQ